MLVLSSIHIANATKVSTCSANDSFTDADALGKLGSPPALVDSAGTAVGAVNTTLGGLALTGAGGVAIEAAAAVTPWAAGAFSAAAAGKEVYEIAQNHDRMPACRFSQGKATLALCIAGIGFAAAAVSGAGLVLAVAGATAGALSVAHSVAIDQFALPIYCNHFETAMYQCLKDHPELSAEEATEICKPIIQKQMSIADEEVHDTAIDKLEEKEDELEENIDKQREAQNELSAALEKDNAQATTINLKIEEERSAAAADEEAHTATIATFEKEKHKLEADVNSNTHHKAESKATLTAERELLQEISHQVEEKKKDADEDEQVHDAKIANLESREDKIEARMIRKRKAQLEIKADIKKETAQIMRIRHALEKDAAVAEEGDHMNSITLTTLDDDDECDATIDNTEKQNDEFVRDVRPNARAPLESKIALEDDHAC
eukprot:TRINITY_DN32919_c0_g1_i1.p1 TRINITY_DN32919_c0_g1~~TRINITY_DN32919_c0_g1_i1.p1  ORF type:complete len:442 (+),score=66.47 TRINITY_DN32919_c0_g1_i1:26-1327(+)